MLALRPSTLGQISPAVYPAAVAAATGVGPQQQSTSPAIAKVGLVTAAIGVIALVVARSRSRARG